MKKQTTATEKTTATATKQTFSMFKREEKNDFLTSPYFLGMVELYHAIQNKKILYATLDEKISLEELAPCTTLGIVTSLYQKNIIDLDIVALQDGQVISSYFDRANRYLFNKDGSKKDENIIAFSKYLKDIDEHGYKIFSLTPISDEEKKTLLEKIEEEKIKRTNNMLADLPF